jgi:protein-disulfide isomerase
MPAQGDATALVAVVEFSDYECPFCAQHATTVLELLRQQFVKTGKIRYLLANLPLPGHSSARLLATAALCAGEQSEYWAMPDLLFRQQPKSEDAIGRLADDLGLEKEEFSNCISDSASSAQIERDLRQAKHLGVDATPTFLSACNRRSRIRKPAPSFAS